MNAPVAAPLLFRWEAPRRRNLALIGFLAASFAAHVFGFYLFQIVYPAAVSLMPAPQRVNLISAKSEQGAALLRWIDAEDPALASTTRRPAEAKRYLVGKIQHVPSYAESEPALKEPPPLTVDLRVPSAQPPGPVPLRQIAKPAAAGRIPTNVTFSGDLQSLGEPKLPPTNFKSSGNEPLQNAQFRIAVDAQGAVVYCFPENSSGGTALDEQARQHLALCRFSAKPASNGDALIWGMATIQWGNDVAISTNVKPTPSAP
jgi:hypothetical protein